MDCNKEEAVRAKGLAEKKMEGKDFEGARKVVQKAQQLFPDLENISQMLMVCDVHCSADRKLYGNETDWYGILQIEQTADEATIRKQYRKFALLLHPDKNKFAGAEAAFKLIGEAQRVLLDKEKRSLHDVKRRAPVTSRPSQPYRPPQQGSRNFSFGVQSNIRTKATFIPQHQRAQPPPPPVQPTFWTVCPFCGMKYQYFKDILGRLLRCQNCSKPFTAHDINGQAATPEGMPTFFQKSDVPNHGSSKVEVESQGTSSTQTVKREAFPRTRYASNCGSKKVNDKRKRKQDMESSESFDTGSSEDDEDQDIRSEQKFEFSGEQNVRRSNRQKQQVSYKENLSDDEQVSPRKRAKGRGSNYATEGENEDKLKEEESKINKQAGSAGEVEDLKEGAPIKESLPNGNKETKKGSGNGIAENDVKKIYEVDSDSESHPKSTPDPEVYVFPDPDFNDFEKVRKEDCFEIGQTWAVYDTVDAMPRFYVLIKKVLSPGFRLRITWLEPDPDDENEIEWVNKELPVSCGKFKHGSSDDTEDRLMFSHLVCCGRGNRKNTCKIYPRKGETWALFKNWGTNWATDADSNRKYEYEFVEILSEYTDAVGLCVAYLGKVKGFVSLFCRIVKEGTGECIIPPNEIYRFSHMVPSFKMSGQERKGVPKGSYELDPACLPTIIEEIVTPVDLEVGVDSGYLNGSCSRSQVGNENLMTECERRSACKSLDDVKVTNLDSKKSNSGNEDCSSPVAASLEAVDYPEPEFYDFDADRTKDKFQTGQLWALYCDDDGLPKYYCEVSQIDHSPDFKLHVSWLAARPLRKNMIQWQDEDMPVSCGIFKVKKVESQAYTNTASFSHQLKAVHTGKKNEYAIFPRQGEVWALYKNWNASMTCSDLVSCEHEIVEVLEDNDHWTKVLALERVGGFNSVFKAQSNGGSAVTLTIGRIDLLSFSHQIPAFRLMQERGGSLRGSWELDPAALPIYFFSN